MCEQINIDLQSTRKMFDQGQTGRQELACTFDLKFHQFEKFRIDSLYIKIGSRIAEPFIVASWKIDATYFEVTTSCQKLANCNPVQIESDQIIFCSVCSRQR